MHSEYAVQAWNSHFQGKIGKIEGVQRKATRIPIGFEKLEYEKRLKILCLTSSKDMWLRGYLIELYKAMSSRKSINWVKQKSKEKTCLYQNKQRLFMEIVLECEESLLVRELGKVSACGQQ